MFSIERLFQSLRPDRPPGLARPVARILMAVTEPGESDHEIGSVRMRNWRFLTVWILLVATAGPAIAQQKFIYPARGQSAAEQENDKYQCSVWAVQQTGFNPTLPAPIPQATAPPPQCIFCAFRKMRYAQEQQEAADQQTSAYLDRKSAYTRALDACLTGRGYTVN